PGLVNSVTAGLKEAEASYPGASVPRSIQTDLTVASVSRIEASVKQVPSILLELMAGSAFPTSQFPVCLVERNCTLNGGFRIENANFAYAKTRTIFRVVDRLILSRKTGSTPGASYTFQPFRYG